MSFVIGCGKPIQAGYLCSAESRLCDRCKGRSEGFDKGYNQGLSVGKMLGAEKVRKSWQYKVWG